MPESTIESREKELKEFKNIFYDALNNLLKLQKENKLTDAQDALNQVHRKAVDYFNEFDSHMDDIASEKYKINDDQRNRKPTDAINHLKVIFNYWAFVKEFCHAHQLTMIVPSETAYSSIQLLIRKFCKRKEIKDIRNRFINANLPVYGFTMKATHSGFKPKYKFHKEQLIISSVLFALSLAMTIFLPTAWGYFMFRVMFSISMASVATSLLTGFINIRMNLGTIIAVTAGGGIGIFVFIYLVNPPPLPDVYSTPKIEKVDTTHNK